MSMDELLKSEFGDARVEELKLLSLVEREPAGATFSAIPSGPWRDLLLWVIGRDLLTAFTIEWGKEFFDGANLGDDSVVPGQSKLDRAVAIARTRSALAIYEGKPTRLGLSHAGRIRLSELKQSIRSGREREPFGILWDVRHWEKDLQIALLDASAAHPVSLAYLDMNGLKFINDTRGHDGGDLALKAYFQAVASVVGDSGQAYRLSGGADEVLVVLPNCDSHAATRIVRLACEKLMQERLWPLDQDALLSISAGIVFADGPSLTPMQFRALADEEQKKAKSESKLKSPRPSVISVKGQNESIIIDHKTSAFPIRISGSFFAHVTKGQGIDFKVTNTGKEPFPPYKISIYHPRLGTFFLFESQRAGPLLPDQQRSHECPIVTNSGIRQWFPRFTEGGDGRALTPTDDSAFEFRLVLEDSDNKVLYRNRRIGRGFVTLVRRAIESGTAIGGTWIDWRELSNELPDVATDEPQSRDATL